MIKTTIEWHRISDQLPDDDALVIAADSDGDTFAAFIDGDAWRYADAIPAPTPEFWAHFPAGPELSRWRVGVEPVPEPLPGSMSDREVMQQVLEALEYMHQEKCDYMRRNNLGDPLREDAARLALPAIAALRARLAEPEPEAVAWMVFTQDGQSVFVTDNPTDIGDDQRALPLYTAPPARPLTDEEIDRITRDKWGDMLFSDVVEVHREFARAIERKITGANDE